MKFKKMGALVVNAKHIKHGINLIKNRLVSTAGIAAAKPVLKLKRKNNGGK
jgi:hypothetical protein